MRNDKVVVGITSIGSGVGQSAIDSCRLSNIPMHVVGYGMNPFAFGSFDCDEQKYLPTIYAADYIERLFEACLNDGIQILIPGLDDELLLLAKDLKRFNDAGIIVPVSSVEVINYCRDKELMYRELQQHADVFVKSYTAAQLELPQIRGSLQYPMIAKPISGFASRGIFIVHSERDLEKVTDNHVIQEIAIPHSADPYHEEFMQALDNGVVAQVGELSLQVLISKCGSELGRFASYNKLQNGVPIEIIPADVPVVWDAIDKLMPIFHAKGIYGPLNIQGRMTDKGPKFFEMNARFTGITGLRALMGFNEVEAIIADAMDLKPGGRKLPNNIKKIGIRQVKNRVVNLNSNQDLYSAVQKALVYPKNVGGLNILVTGANSYLGREVLELLLREESINEIVALVRDPMRFEDGAEPRLPEGVKVMSIQALDDGQLQLGNIDVICHLAAARPVHSMVEIADSLEFTRKMVSLAMRFNIRGFINASSQAVYGTQREPLWSEDVAVAPETIYAQAKWAGEVMVSMIRDIDTQAASTSLRFSQLIGDSPVFRLNELAHKMLFQLSQGSSLQVLGGTQKLDLLNVRDAARSVVSLIRVPFKDWPRTLNIGSGNPVSIMELAQECVKAAKPAEDPNHHIVVQADYQAPSFGMNINLSQQKIAWRPEHRLEVTLKEIFKRFSE